MAVYNGPSCKKCRALGLKLFLKGDRCVTEKCAFERSPYPPGKDKTSRRKLKNYTEHLLEKQKAKVYYGILERQFRRYFRNAKQMEGQTGENLVKILERRLDNIVYKAGFAASSKQARQLIGHGNVLLNGRKTTIASLIVNKNDIISVKEKLRDSQELKDRIDYAYKSGIAPWLSLDPNNMSVKVLDIPSIEDIRVPFKADTIVELYSR
ncbi:SSU ribosomal protein S4p (S9e) [Desulfurella amilsii]|uniref:Small ribosomal subunit protein uS4 n=1 Tax=Desulfurella amilsii TaxID=1562698 RepID=A0A1X4XWT3_9BACT|nr:30S ribosomal protein S4 [Desulfurella amilsii]OSS41996.1 SSU ribosomal protein S4p (S9e) [Desulfurella amilsii]